jgi:hypothetical protein
MWLCLLRFEEAVVHEEYFILSFIVPHFLLCGTEKTEWLGNNVAHVTKMERYKKEKKCIYFYDFFKYPTDV